MVPQIGGIDAEGRVDLGISAVAGVGVDVHIGRHLRNAVAVSVAETVVIVEGLIDGGHGPAGPSVLRAVELVLEAQGRGDVVDPDLREALPGAAVGGERIADQHRNAEKGLDAGASDRAETAEVDGHPIVQEAFPVAVGGEGRIGRAARDRRIADQGLHGRRRIHIRHRRRRRQGHGRPSSQAQNYFLHLITPCVCSSTARNDGSLATSCSS